LEPPTPIREDLKANVIGDQALEGLMVGRLEDQHNQEKYLRQEQFISPLTFFCWPASQAGVVASNVRRKEAIEAAGRPVVPAKPRGRDPSRFGPEAVEEERELRLIGNLLSNFSCHM
jgi:hypothetical protein